MILSNREKVGVVLVLCLASFAVGRFGATSKSEVRTAVTSQAATKMVDHKVAESASQTLTDDHKKRVTIIYRDRLVSGEVKERIVTKYMDRVVTNTTAAQRVEEVKTVAKTEDKKVETTIKPPAQPRWSVQAGLGTSIRLSPTVLVSIQYRLVGPFSIGAWSTIPTYDVLGSAMGLSVGLQF